MKILVFSDSHGRTAGMERAIDSHPDAAYILHAGDGAREFSLMRGSRPGAAFVGVRGNCDFLLETNDKPPLQTVLDIEGVRILLTHGHRYFVKSSTYALTEYAAENDIDIAIYGHTHLPADLFLPDVGRRGLRLFNPGTVSGSGTGICTYGIIEIRPNGILTSHASVFA